MICDTLIILVAGIVSGMAYNFATTNDVGDIGKFAGYASVAAALFVCLAQSRDLYEPPELLNFRPQLQKTAVTWAMVMLFLTAVAFAMKIGGNFSRGATLSFAAISLGALAGQRALWRVFLGDSVAVHCFAGRKIVLVTEATEAETILPETLTRSGLKPVRHFVLPGDARNVAQRRAAILQVIAFVRGTDVQEIVVGADVGHWPELSDILRELRVLPLPVNLVPLGKSSQIFELPLHTIGDTVTIELQRGPLTVFERTVKRAIDIFGALVAVVMLIPLLVVVSAAIKIDSRGPVLFRQKRCGFNGRTFEILKFRTMTVQEDGAIITQATRHDDRVTQVGRWLRRTSIDELPQLFNVLKGNMSLIGPRPHAIAHDGQFDKAVRNYAYRHHVLPGLTGWAQVNGYRGETRTIKDIEQRVRHDLWYIDNWSLGLDFRVAMMTLSAVLSSKNAY